MKKLRKILPGKDREEKAKKTVRVLGFASFFNDLGSDMIYPVWPLFLTSVLGANMVILGLIDGLGDALVSLSQAASGYLSDRTKKRKVFVWFGNGVPQLYFSAQPHINYLGICTLRLP